MDQLPARDDIPYSYSRPDLVAVTHTRLKLTVNFERHVLEGRAILSILKKPSTCNDCNELVLDNYKLKIGDVTDYSTGEILRKTIGNHDKNFGSQFTITLPSVASAVGTSRGKRKKLSNSNIFQIKIKYETHPESPALHWLKRYQTSDGINPLLISNTKLTYARAIFPCQDTPSNRITFYFEITVPKNFNVMMPGLREKVKRKGGAVKNNQDKYSFSFGTLYDTTQPHKGRIPPYAIHIIVGCLRSLHGSREEVPRPMYLEIWHAKEKSCERCIPFLDKIVDIVYKIKESYGFLGEFVNVCVLPPNVPEFDMQYPYMTFVSSSLLEGDQYSIIDTIVQNIIESWIGRTVAIDNFKDLWLIKGLSTFIYRNPINDEIIDNERKFRNDLKIKGINNLLSMPELYSHSLVPIFTKEFLPINIIKYVSEKGCIFLNYLENKLGGPKDFTCFLVHILLPFYEKTEHDENRAILTTDRFKILLNVYFFLIAKDELSNSVDWDGWLYRTGVPASQSDSMTIRKTYWQDQADQWILQETTASFDTIRKLGQSNNLVIIEFLTYLLALPNTVLTEDKLRMLRLAFLRDQNVCEI
ncbi:leukotriene A-4 hydrolase-like, partial [Temnothorax curvispinosus]|uniref:Leukotriene A-4 hydrolase-like n=1 Tax=Temnothorax curvispinosus TaxID=300111 RepID=A0A6J1RFN5_9HYME